jgi:hypothetical protein
MATCPSSGPDIHILSFLLGTTEWLFSPTVIASGWSTTGVEDITQSLV